MCSMLVLLRLPIWLPFSKQGKENIALSKLLICDEFLQSFRCVEKNPLYFAIMIYPTIYSKYKSKSKRRHFSHQVSTLISVSFFNFITTCYRAI